MKEMSNETRVLLALGLSVFVIIGWNMIYKPPPRVVEPPPIETQAPATAPQAPASAPGTATTPATGTTQQAATQPAPGARAASEERLVTIENGFLHVELSNRGGVARSWQLINYIDDAKPAKTLDVILPQGAQAVGAWPLSFSLDDKKLEEQLNGALFEVAAPPGDVLRAPAEIVFEWSDGQLAASKRFKFDESYVVGIETSVTLNGQPLAHAIAWRGGFGDETAYAHAESVKLIYRNGGKVERLEHKKLGQPDKREQRLRQEGTAVYAGIEDRYFAAIFLPQSTDNGGGLALWHWKNEREATIREKKEKVPVAEVAAGSTAPTSLAMRLFVGPKSLEVLAEQRPSMTEIVDFGWFSFFAEGLFRLLRWIHEYVPNWGWAIILMTVLINIILFPLKVKSWRSMQKMQKLMPEIQSIKAKYSKYPLRDPRRQQEGQETWALYKKEGVNPMGGCLPMALQMPIWIALYQMLNASIELRHAPWMFWLRDLSSPDPYYVLPILMAVTMYAMQKMTPVTTPDPAQQKMMMMMPLMIGGMFVIFPVSSGLVLYILTSNMIAMVQQWYLNKTSPMSPAKHKPVKK